jgi:hypothetical protein
MLFVVLGTTGVLVILIMAGIADPRPIGQQVVDDSLNNSDGWSVFPRDTSWKADQDGLHLKADAQSQVYLSAPYVVACPCTIEIATRQSEGARDAHFGLWWGEGAEHQYTATGLNGNGYFGIFSFDEGEASMLVDWHVFPWVLPHGESNRLRVNLMDGGRGEVLINEEDAAEITWAGGALQMGVFVETTASGESAVVFERLQIWQK